MTKKALVLRTSNKDRRSRGDFQWPESGPVEAPDWDPTPECGNGLHGALWGEGNGYLFDWTPDATWQVVEVDADSIVDLGRKVKFPRGTVVFSGDQKGATEYILSHPEGKDRAVIGAIVTVGDHGTATVGDYGRVTAGAYGIAIAENYGTATAGDHGAAEVGYKGTAVTGDFGTAVTGDFGTATSGYKGTAVTGDFGTATVGDFGTVLAGEYSTVSAGEGGSINIKWYNQRTQQYHLSTRYIGENGLEPNTFYKIDDEGNFVPAE